jgi:vitamin B12 transporter
MSIPRASPSARRLSVFWVGERFDNVSGFGQVSGGKYTVVDLFGRYFLEPRRRHRLNVRLENLFDQSYATGHGRGLPDAGGAPFVTTIMGVPRTLHVSYTFAY